MSSQWRELDERKLEKQGVATAADPDTLVGTRSAGTNLSSGKASKGRKGVGAGRGEGNGGTGIGLGSSALGVDEAGFEGGGEGRKRRRISTKEEVCVVCALCMCCVCVMFVLSVLSFCAHTCKRVCAQRASVHACMRLVACLRQGVVACGWVGGEGRFSARKLWGPSKKGPM